MKSLHRRLALGVCILLCLLIALCFGNRLDLREEIAHLSLSSLPSQLLSRGVVSAESKSSCPKEDLVDSSLDFESLGAKYLKQGKLKLAQHCLENWVAQLERNPRPRKLDLAIALGNVGWSLQVQGENSQAIPFLQRSLALFEREAGLEKKTLIFWLTNLAYAEKHVGDYEEAEKLFKRALAIAEKSFGRETSQVAATLNDLGGCYLTEGKIDKALTAYKRALAIDEKVLAPSSSSVSRDLCNLAECYREQGKLRAAEPLFKRVLATLDKTGNSEHIVATYTCNNLGQLYFSQGRYSLAEGLFKRALATRIKLLGPGSPYVGLTLTKYAILLRKTNRIVEAVKLEERARKTYPFDQSQIPDGKIAELDKQAHQRLDEKDFTSANRLYRQSLDLAREQRPNSQLQLASRLKNLALACQEIGNCGEAEMLLKQCIAMREHSANATSLEMAGYFDILAFNYDLQQRYADAQIWYLKTLKLEESGQVQLKRYLPQTLSNLGNVCMRQSKYKEATGYYIRARLLSEKDLGPDNSNLPWILNNLAFCYQKQGNHQVAEPLYKRALNIRRKIRTFLYPSIATIEENYNSLLAAKN